MKVGGIDFDIDQVGRILRPAPSLVLGWEVKRGYLQQIAYCTILHICIFADCTTAEYGAAGAGTATCKAHAGTTTYKAHAGSAAYKADAGMAAYRAQATDHGTVDCST